MPTEAISVHNRSHVGEEKLWESWWSGTGDGCFDNNKKSLMVYGHSWILQIDTIFQPLLVHFLTANANTVEAKRFFFNLLLFLKKLSLFTLKLNLILPKNRAYSCSFSVESTESKKLLSKQVGVFRGIRIELEKVCLWATCDFLKGQYFTRKHDFQEPRKFLHYFLFIWGQFFLCSLCFHARKTIEPTTKTYKWRTSEKKDITRSCKYLTKLF